MYNTLYTHRTDISFNHTHMHNKMLCTSKIGFNFCSKLNTDWLSTTPAWCSRKDSTEARVGGHACEVSISSWHKELKPFFHQARHLFWFGHQGFVLLHRDRAGQSKRKTKQVKAGFRCHSSPAGRCQQCEAQAEEVCLIDTFILILKSPVTGLCPEDGH